MEDVRWTKKLQVLIVFFLTTISLVAAEKLNLPSDIKFLDSCDGWMSEEITVGSKKFKLYFELTAPTEEDPGISGALGVSYGVVTDSVLGSFEDPPKKGRMLIFKPLCSEVKLQLNYEIKEEILILNLKNFEWPKCGKLSGTYKFYRKK